MGSDFSPYVGYVIPDLLKKASVRPTIQPLESELNVEPCSVINRADCQTGDGTEDEVNLPPGMDVINFHETSRIAIDSKAMEEKGLAFEALPEYLSTLDAITFAPYLDQALVVTLETVDFMWDPNARTVSAGIVRVKCNRKSVTDLVLLVHLMMSERHLVRLLIRPYFLGQG